MNERPYFDKETRDRAVDETQVRKAHGGDRLQGVQDERHRSVGWRWNPDVSQPDENTLNWEVTGPDADDFMVMQVQDINDGKDRVELRFKEQPDYERPDRPWQGRW